jgi:hypothetical protein
MSLPDELLTKIVKQLFIPSFIDVPNSETTVAPEALRDFIISVNPGAIEAREALARLACTNHRLNAVTNSVLYHSIHLQSHRSLFLIIWTFLKSPRLGLMVQELSVAVKINYALSEYHELDRLAVQNLVEALHHSTGDRDVLRTFSKVVVGFPDLRDRLEDCIEHWAGMWEKLVDNNFAHLSCILLLGLTPTLTTLRFMLPSTNINDSQFIRSTVASRIDQRIFPQLERLRLTSDLRRFDPETQLPKLAPNQFLNGRKVKHVELYGPVLVDADIVTDPWVYVETLRMQWAQLSGSWLHTLCKETRPPLRNLEISMSDSGHTILQEEDQQQPGINEALSFCKGTLETLSLWHGGPSGTEPHLGPTGRLDLSSMEVLSCLAISVRFLFASLEDLRRNSICTRLPRSLRKLQLHEEQLICTDPDPWADWEVDHTDHTEGNQPTYPQLISQVMLQLAFESSDWLPHLEEVEVTRGEKEWDHVWIVEKFGDRGRFCFVPITPHYWAVKVLQTFTFAPTR